MKNNILSLLFLFAPFVLQAQEIAVITVEAGASDRFETPVNMSLDPITLHEYLSV